MDCSNLCRQYKKNFLWQKRIKFQRNKVGVDKRNGWVYNYHCGKRQKPLCFQNFIREKEKVIYAEHEYRNG